MKSKIIFISILLLSTACSRGASQTANQPSSVNTNPSQATTTVTQPPVDRFVNDSAREVTNQNKNEIVKSNTNATTVESTSKIKFICAGAQANDFDCYENYYQNVVQTEGLKVAFEDLKKRYSANSYVRSQCHPIVHVLGRAAVQMYPTVGEAYAQGDSFCWSGYYHGVLEGVIGKVGQRNLEAQMDLICKDIPGKEKYSFDYYNCVHGLGHGVMAYTQDELFDALKLCDKVNGLWEQNSCYGGVFMENVIIDNKNHFTKYLKPSEPLYPCSAVDDKYKNTCYLMQTSYMLKVTNEDFAKVFELCSTVEENYRATCYQSLGRDASGHSVSNVIATKSHCDLGKDETQKSNCIVGAVKDFVSYFHGLDQAKEFCNSWDINLATMCNDTAENYYKTF